jgi:hypothetical protein
MVIGHFGLLVISERRITPPAAQSKLRRSQSRAAENADALYSVKLWSIFLQQDENFLLFLCTDSSPYYDHLCLLLTK